MLRGTIGVVYGGQSILRGIAIAEAPPVRRGHAREQLTGGVVPVLGRPLQRVGERFYVTIGVVRELERIALVPGTDPVEMRDRGQTTATVIFQLEPVAIHVLLIAHLDQPMRFSIVEDVGRTIGADIMQPGVAKETPRRTGRRFPHRPHHATRGSGAGARPQIPLLEGKQLLRRVDDENAIVIVGS